MLDFIAAIKHDSTGTAHDGSAFDLRAGETYSISRVGNPGVYIETVIGEVLVGFRDFTFTDINDVAIVGNLLDTVTGDPRDTSVDVVRLGVRS